MRKSLEGGESEKVGSKSPSAAQKRDLSSGECSDGGSGTLQDDAHRRELRGKYRELINSVQKNREDMLNPSNNMLTDVLVEANSLFKGVKQTREAALDAQLLVVATDLGKEKASQLFSEGASFDPSVFAEHLSTFMGLNRLEGAEDEAESRGYLPSDAWDRLARGSESCFRTAPTFHYMLGSFHVEPPPPKQRIERQARDPNKEAKRNMPTQLKKMEESHQEATEKEVERILGYLKSYHQDDPSTPISYYEFVIDPTSFSRTVENMFHVSFLIRDGLAGMYLDEDKLPCIAPAEEGMGDEASSRKQCVISISIDSWKELIEAFDISEAMIRPLSDN